jgi:predicted dehydrogenase
MGKNKNMNRRDFIKTGAAVGIALTVGPNIRILGKDDRKVRLGFLGVGGQGTNILRTSLVMEDVEVSAVCDIKVERVTKAQELVEKSGRKKPEGYTNGEEDFRNMVTRNDIDGIIIATPWLWHTPMAVAAMKAGKYCAPEVWGASSIEELWDLVNTSEETGMPCMMLENHCYDRSNMAVLRMVREGLFGELTHCQCGYCHDLLGVKFRPGVQFGPGAQGEAEWRTFHSVTHNGDLYPTHGLGPIANCLNTDRGNRMVSLTSTATKSRSLHEYIVRNVGEDHPNAKINFALGDIVTTVIKCANGETIIINHDTNSPRPYSNMYVVQGTRGVWMEHRDLVNAIYIDGKSPEHKWESFDKYQEEYEHPLWKKSLETKEKYGHGGADYLKTRAFVECVKRKIPTPIDVYDTAAWTVVTPLSEESVAKGGAPVGFPDFTRGNWMKNKPIFGLTDEY